MDSKIQYISSITKGFDVLRLFNEGETELGIREISTMLAMNKTTVYRIVKTLELNGMLIQNPINSKYSPGFSILEMAHKMFKNYDDKKLLSPFMKDLQNEFNEDVVLSVLNGTNAVCIDRLESNNGLVISAHVGRILPIVAGATGKVFLPYIPKDTLDIILKNSRDSNSKQVTSKTSLEKDIEKIVTSGYITSEEEIDTGVFAIAVPVFDDKGDAKYSLGICGSVERIKLKGIDTIANRLLEVKDEISKRLGHLSMVKR